MGRSRKVPDWEYRRAQDAAAVAIERLRIASEQLQQARRVVKRMPTPFTRMLLHDAEYDVQLAEMVWRRASALLMRLQLCRTHAGLGG